MKYRILITIVQHNHNFMEYSSPIIYQYVLCGWLLMNDVFASSGFTDLACNLVRLALFISKSFALTKKRNNIAHGINITT